MCWTAGRLHLFTYDVRVLRTTRITKCRRNKIKSTTEKTAKQIRYTATEGYHLYNFPKPIVDDAHGLFTNIVLVIDIERIICMHALHCCAFILILIYCYIVSSRFVSFRMIHTRQVQTHRGACRIDVNLIVHGAAIICYVLSVQICFLSFVLFVIKIL